MSMRNLNTRSLKGEAASKMDGCHERDKHGLWHIDTLVMESLWTFKREHGVQRLPLWEG